MDALLKNRVEFLVVGGMAVHFYDATRLPDDLDLMVRQTSDNAERLRTALSQAGLRPDFLISEFMRPKRQQISLKNLPPNNYNIDIVTAGPDVDVDVEWTNGQSVRLNNFDVAVVSRDCLLKMKRKGDREKDRDDVRRLEALVS